MPSTINGCGTWYYGKGNRQTYQGVCSHCRAQANLDSYDTRLWIVVLFIPVFPLGRKRIIEECPSCRRHGVMPFADWERVQRRGQDAVAAYTQSPADPELAKEAMAATVSFRDINGFTALATQIEQHLTAHASTMAMVGGAYLLFQRLDDAERVLRAALVHNEQDEDLREALAVCLMRQGEPAEAELLLQHIIDKGIPDRVDALYQLAQTYQIKGEHAHAVAVFDQCELVNPHMAQDETFQRLREASQKRIGRQVKVNPSDVVAQANREASMRKFRRWAPIAAVLLVAAYLSVAWIQGRSRDVFLVNGLSRPYTATLNGVSYQLSPQSAMKVRLGEGDVQVAIADAPAGIEPQTVQIATSFLTRPFSDATFVINPDGAAVLERVRVYYSDKDSVSQREPQVTLAGGQVLHRFDDLDYPFESFPDEIRVDRGASNVGRDGVAIFGQQYSLPPATALMAAIGDLGGDTVTKIAQRHLALEPEQNAEEYLAILRRTMEGEAFATFLWSRLDERPVVMLWHRAYQQSLRSAGRQRDAEQQYEDLLAVEPGNGDLMYLLARVKEDHAEGAALCRQAVSQSPPNGWAHFWLSGYHLARGEFAPAADHGMKAAELLPDSIEVGHFSRQALLAAERWEPLLVMLRVAEQGPISLFVPALEEQAYVHQQMGHADAAREAVQRLQAKLTPFDSQFAMTRSNTLRAALDYAAGDTSTLVQAAQGHADKEVEMSALLTIGDLAGAEKTLEAMQDEPEVRAFWDVLIYITAMQRGNASLAQQHLKAATDFMAAQPEDVHRRYAELLATPSTQAFTRIVDQHDQLRRKAAMLVAVGLAHPSLREQAFTLANKLNCDRRFPHLLLKLAMQSPPPPPPAPAPAPSAPKQSASKP